MQKYAVIQLGARQYTVHENDVFEVEKQNNPLKALVLFFSDGSKNMVGDPILKDVVVKMSVLEEKRQRKIFVGRFKSKSRYKKKKGHRQELSVIKIDRISLAGEKEEIVEPKKVEPKKKEVKTVKKVVKKAAKKEAPKSKSKKLVKKTKK